MLLLFILLVGDDKPIIDTNTKMKGKSILEMKE